MNLMLDANTNRVSLGKRPLLGPSISRSIIVEHDGTMNVESKPGKGITFSIELPKSTAAETESASVPE